jgi:nicotinamidase-related amidase
VSLLDRFERHATILPLRRAGAHEDLVAQAVDEKRTWREIQRDIELAGDPTALTGGIAGLELTPPIVNETLVTGTATEQAIFSTARTAIGAAPRAPVLYRLFAAGTSTTAATPGTYTL